MSMTCPHGIDATCLLVELMLGTCAPQDCARRSDREARGILNATQGRELGSRYESVSRPKTALPAPPVESESGASVPPVPATDVGRELLDPAQGLELAVQGNRDQETRREALFLQVLSLLGVCNSFSPQLSLTPSYLFSDDDDLVATHSTVGSAGFTQVLPWGGSEPGNLGSDDFGTESGGSFATSASIAMTQPSSLLASASPTSCWPGSRNEGRGSALAEPRELDARTSWCSSWPRPWRSRSSVGCWDV